MDSMPVGIVGAGWMAREHRRVLGSLDGVGIAAVCDVERKRAEDRTAMPMPDTAPLISSRCVQNIPGRQSSAMK